jgi:hypothetical protein
MLRLDLMLPNIPKLKVLDHFQLLDNYLLKHEVDCTTDLQQPLVILEFILILTF